MSLDADFVSDLNSLPDDVVSANEGNIETHRGSEDVPLTRADKPKTIDAPNETTEKSLSLRDQISNAIKGTDTPPAAQIDGGVQRNPDGTFAPKPAGEPEAAVAAPVVSLPSGIPGLDAAVFATLPAETQQHVARTMETLNQQAAQFTAYADIERVIAPRRQAWALNGMGDGQVINQLFALSDFAEKSPVDFVKYFAQQRGLDLEDIVYGTDPVDPVTAATNQRIQQLEAQINGFTAQQQQAAHSNTVDEVVKFAEEKDASGQLLRPYFPELGNTIVPFIQMAMQQNPGKTRNEVLAIAYDSACYASPSIRAKVLAADNAAREAARLREQTSAATRARTAGVSVSGGNPGDGSTNAANASRSGNLRDTIKAAMAATT
jgi:hypothetical protein